jgi:dephospho-CoA kinase
LKTTCGHRALRVDHIGSTAIPGLDAKDVIDIQVTVESLAVADELAEVLLPAGYPRLDHITQDAAKLDARSSVDRYDHSDDSALWHKRIHASADPGRPTNVHVRVDGWPNQQFALLFVDWLTANPDACAGYLEVKRTADASGRGDIIRYVTAKEPWFSDAYRRAWEWADSSGWRPNSP